MPNKIAVILANHNYSDYIHGALYSCRDQSRKPDFVVIIDDDSTDDSKDKILGWIEPKNPPIIENGLTIYQAKDIDVPQISYIFVPLPKTTGPSLARNIGIDLIKHQVDFFQILDADDEMYSSKLEILEKKICESPEIGVVYADYDNLNMNTGNCIREWKEPYSRKKLLQECIVHSSSMIRKEALLAVQDQFGYYDINLRCAEDYDLWLRISEKFTISHVPQSLTLVRVHNNNATYSVKNEVWQACWNRVRQKLESRNR